MSSAAKPSMATRPTNSSFFLVKPNRSLMPRKSLGLLTRLMFFGSWTAPADQGGKGSKCLFHSTLSYGRPQQTIFDEMEESNMIRKWDASAGIRMHRSQISAANWRAHIM